MKKFIKYKGFLPPRYVDEKISKNKKNNKKAIWMLVILNFYMLPVNFRNVLKETNDEKIVNIAYYNENEKLIEDISKWLEVASLGIDSIEVKENKGIVSVLNKDILCDVENSGYGIIKITQENSIYKANIVKDD